MLIIFDLDGTLIDSSRDLGTSTNATRAHFNLPPLEQHVINSYVGNGAAALVERAMGPDTAPELRVEALEFFLQYYRAHALEHTRLYTGVREMLEDLSRAKHRLGVLTNKPERISADILEALHVQKLFFRVYGGNTFSEKKPHPMGLLKMIEEAAIPAHESLMVGDSSVDIATARNAGVRSCGVLWGFQPETFAGVAPDFTIAHPGELAGALLSAPQLS